MHCLEKNGVKTIAELRQWPDQRLMGLRNFGVISLDRVQWFFRWAERLEQGRAELPHIQAWLREFLNEQEIFAIEHRYGLKDPLFRPHMRRRTLREIADIGNHLTRERIRQVEEIALIKLRSRLSRAVSTQLAVQWTSRLMKTGGILSSSDLGSWVGDPSLGGYQPWGALLLVSDTIEHILYRHDCFINLCAQTLDKVEQKITGLLQKANAPVPLDRIVTAVANDLPIATNLKRRFAATLLDHHSQVGGATGPCYFLNSMGVAQMLAAILREKRDATHYHELTRLYNERILPHSRRGTGYILHILSTSPVFRCRSRGIYEMSAR